MTVSSAIGIVQSAGIFKSVRAVRLVRSVESVGIIESVRNIHVVKIIKQSALSERSRIFIFRSVTQHRLYDGGRE